MSDKKADKHKKICDEACEGRGSLRMKIPIRSGTYLLLALGISFIVIGAFRSEFETILLNALILCASCIGLR
jgi:hypothetical protein